MTNKWLWDFKIHGTATLWPKSQVVVPKEVRDIMWINPWDDLVIITKSDKAVVFIKADNLTEFMDYVENHLTDNSCQ